MKDVVCGMTVDPKNAAKSEYKGQTYFFCCNGCKAAFDKNPAKFAAAQTDSHAEHHH